MSDELPPIYCYFAIEATTAVIVLVLGLTYAFIAPTLLPACALYFGASSVVYRWLFKYVYEPEFQCAGAFWYDLFNGVMIGMLMGTFTLLAVASSYFSYRQFLALWPVLFLEWYLFKRCQRK